MSTQALQPLIWLARRLMSSSVRSGTLLFLVAAARAGSAFTASGTITTGCFVRACISHLLHQSLLKTRHLGLDLASDAGVPASMRVSHGLHFLRQRHDGWRRGRVTNGRQKMADRAIQGQQGSFARGCLGEEGSNRGRRDRGQVLMTTFVLIPGALWFG